MFPIVMMQATEHPDIPGHSASIPCSSAAVAEAWKKCYLDAGWTVVWITGWMSIETEPPKEGF